MDSIGINPVKLVGFHMISPLKTRLLGDVMGDFLMGKSMGYFIPKDPCMEYLPTLALC